MTVSRDRAVVATLVASELAIGLLYAREGAGYVLDDWFTLGNRRVDGIWSTPGHLIFVNRPGAGLIYCIVFGVFGGHPLVGLTLLTALSAATAVLVYCIARRLLDWHIAAAVAGAWVVLPNHTSLEYWQSCVPLSAATVALLLGALVMTRPEVSWRRAGAAAMVLTVASLTYEAVFPAAVVAVALLPLLAGRRWQWRRALGEVCLLLPAAIYLVRYRSTQKSVSTVAPLQQALPGHFGWGVIRGGPLATAVLAIALVLMLAALLRLALPGFRNETGLGERLIAFGLLVIVMGAIPFTFYLYAPLGAGDRFTLVSAIGGALAWVGVGVMLWRWRALVVGAALALAVLATVAHVDRIDRWTTAAADGQRIVATVVARSPTPPTAPVILGPSPVQEANVAAFLDQSNVTGMLRYLYGTDVAGGITYTRADYDRFPPEQRVDVWALSRLHPDVDLSVDRQGLPRTAG